MSTATLSSKGQLTLPKAIRDAFSLEAGDRVAFRLRADGTAVLQPLTQEVLSLFGALKPRVRGVSLEQLDEAIGKGGEEK